MESLVDPSFWNGKRVLLTGNTGFKGSWLALWLNKMGAKLSAYSLPPPTTPSLFEAIRAGELFDTTIGDVRDLDHVVSTVKHAQPEIVFHMAAQSLVRLSYEEPVATYSTNVMGTVHLLEAARVCPSVKAIVVVSSDKCYENREWDWGYREIEPMGGYDPYSNSKGCTELVVSGYRSSYFHPSAHARHGVGLASARAGNVIGGGDWANDRLVPDFIRAIMAGEELRVRSPYAIRPWQHVLEPLSGYLALAQKLCSEEGSRYAEGWNFGPCDEDAQSVAWLVNMLVNLWGEDASWLLDNKVHPHESSYLKLDTSKARRHIGWQPRWDLTEALVKIVEWYRAYRAGRDMREISLAQISAYEGTYQK